MTMSKYEAFAEMIRDQIRSGQLKPGERLLSYSQYQQQGWKRTTIMLAMRTLRAEGWVRGQPGEAVFVADHPPGAATD